jgi:hypothetical protein
MMLIASSVFADRSAPTMSLASHSGQIHGFKVVEFYYDDEEYDGQSQDDIEEGLRRIDNILEVSSGSGWVLVEAINKGKDFNKRLTLPQFPSPKLAAETDFQRLGLDP